MVNVVCEECTQKAEAKNYLINYGPSLNLLLLVFPVFRVSLNLP